MKPTTILLILSLFALQILPTNTVYLDAQIPERDGPSIPHFQAFQVLFNLPSVVTGFLEYQDTLESLVKLYQYFLHEKLFKKLLHDIFRFADADGNGVVAREEYETVLRDAGIFLPQAQRAYALAAIENPSRDLGAGDFEVAMELLLDESISQVTFAYLLGTPENSEDVGIDKQRLISGLGEIFARLPKEYPMPGCDQLEYLFDRFDQDDNGLLNIEEFFRVLSIFLRYYKAGISNNAYAKLVQRDNVFILLWQREIAEAAFKVQQIQLRQSVDDFFQMAVLERILNTIAQSIFKLIDENENGTIELQEFKKAIALFQAPESEAVLLYTKSDTDGNGSLDFGGFLKVFESFVRKGLTKLGYAIFQTNGLITNLENISKLWRDLATAHAIDLGLTDEAFKVLYDTLDVDHNGMLDVSEFTQLTSVMVTSIKKHLREKTDLEITVMSSQNATNANIQQALEEKTLNDKVNEDVGTSQAILARILGKASIESSAFSSTADSGDETGSTGNANDGDGLTVDNNVDADLGNSLDSGHAPGIGIGFSLYDAVRQATQTNPIDQLRTEEERDPLSPLGVKVLLQGQLGDLVKFSK